MHLTGFGEQGQSPRARVEQQVIAVLQTQAGLEEHLESIALPVERVDNVSPRLDHRRLEHVAQQGQHRVKRLVLALTGRTVCDASHQLGEDGQVEDEWRGQKRVLALVENVLSKSAGANEM